MRDYIVSYSREAIYMANTSDDWRTEGWKIKDGVLLGRDYLRYLNLIPNGVTKIAKFECPKCTSSSYFFVIPPSVKEIEEFAFSGTNNGIRMESIYIPDTVERIDATSFQFTYPKKVRIPDKSIFTSEFFNMLKSSELEELIISNHTSEDRNNQDFIGAYSLIEMIAKETNIKIKTLVITGEPLSNEELNRAMIYFPNTEIINGDYEQEKLTLIDETWAIYDGVLYDYYGSDTKVTIPDGVKTIAVNALANKNLEKVTFPESLTFIESLALAGNNLQKLNLPPNLKNIAKDAFYGIQVDTLKIPKNVRNVGTNAFNGDIRNLILYSSCISSFGPAMNDYFGKSVETITIVYDKTHPSVLFKKLCTSEFPHLKKVIIIGCEIPVSKRLMMQADYIRQMKKTVKIVCTDKLEEQQHLTIPTNTLQEAKEVLNKINSSLDKLTDAERMKIIEYVDELLSEYRTSLERVKPTSLGDKEEIELTIGSEDPIYLYSNLLAKLERLFNSINQIGSTDPTEIPKRYLAILEEETVEKPRVDETIEDKLAFINYVAKRWNEPIYKKDVKKALEKIIEGDAITIDDILKDTNLRIDKNTSNSEESINEAYFCSRLLDGFYSSIKGDNSDLLAIILKQVEWIISPFDKSTKDRFQTKIESLKLLIPYMIKVYKLDTKEKLFIEIKNILDEISQIDFFESARKKLVEELEEALTYLEADDPELSDNEFILTTATILGLQDSVSEEIADESMRRMKNALTTWIANVQNWSEADEERLLCDPATFQTVPFYTPNRYETLAPLTLIRIKIQKSLMAVKLDLEIHINKLEEVKRFNL
ncbi:MAG TPA: hypothetical protein DCY94_00150 [Firmicutes bacterium]|nr:hypothetical protein [Bacillota bacterium]